MKYVTHFEIVPNVKALCFSRILQVYQGDSQLMKWFVSAVTFIIALAVCAVIGIYVVLFLAGPHSGILPIWAISQYLF
ncbi:MAG: hypothetical protein HAW67_01250 [Endozoicomonadaceae bacterium]|nr:hypothetical protein [Endozoicomonadaceae bacterium]